ncbi:MAG TPA: hypothetical protein VMU51_21665 [Mycobacteriales bacterium]|nr:hypothetical protein [Mycobacteriales bacterium]
MTDYNYDQHRVTLGDDRSQNAATGLTGYPLDVRPDAHWPGLDRNPREQRFDQTAMNDVADKIDQLIADVGTINVSSAGAVSFGPDSWQAAVYLKHASGQVAGAVQTYSQQLIQNLQQAAAAIRAAAGNYAGAENASSTGVGNVNNNLAASGEAPSGPSPAPW